MKTKVKKKTGVEEITEERGEQINKHGFDINDDVDYGKGELIRAALYAINPDVFEWPYEWDDTFKKKIARKNKIQRLRVAGALIASEIDRLKHLEK